MIHSFNELETKLDMLYKLHISLDKIGMTIYPDSSSKEYVELLLNEITKLHYDLDEYRIKNPHPEIADMVNDTVVNIFHKIINDSDSIMTAEEVNHYEKFSNFVGERMLALEPDFETQLHLEFKDVKETSYASQKEKLIKNGLFLEWFDDGSVKTIGLYKDNSASGVWVRFKKDGTLISRDNYATPKQLEFDTIPAKNTTSILNSNASADDEEIGLGAIMIGSIGFAFLSSLLSKNKKRKQKLIKQQEIINEIKEEIQI